MRKRILKKSEVLREGYVKGLKKAQAVINEMLVQTQGFDEGELEADSFSSNGRKGDKLNDKGNPKANDELLVGTQSRDLKKVKQALKNGALSDARYKQSNKTPLIVAAANGDIAICELLLSFGANVNAKDKNGWTALHYATRDRQTEVVELLLRRQANISAKDDGGWTPLHWAARMGDTQSCELLLAKHADVNAKDNDGWTPLHAAALLGNTKACKILLDNGADADAMDNDGHTPLKYAHNRNQRECCDLIQQYL